LASMDTLSASVKREEKFSVKGMVVLSRLPFLSPGLAALVTGVGLAWAAGFQADMGLLAISLVGLAFIMLATYYFNEYYDFEGDLMNRRFTAFSGGSRALPDMMMPRRVARIAGWISIGVLIAVAIAYMLFYFGRYPLLLPMALIGAFCGVFYSHPPFRWAYRGIGEILIGGCYGMLAVTGGYYLISGAFEPSMLVIALPASFSIFCVIVANEFSDIDADRAVNKKSLVVRFGLDSGAKIYAVAMGAVYPLMLCSMLVGVSPMIALFGLPVLLLCAAAVGSTLKGGYKVRELQKKISGMTLIANLLSSLLFIPVMIIW